MAASALKDELRVLLDAEDYGGIVEAAKKRSGVVRALISMTYDKRDVLSWRAMLALGRTAASMSAGEARSVIQRLLWMMREESGANPWSAGETIAEIVRMSPEHFEDIAPIAISFHEEEMLRPGALWFMHRVGEVRPGLVGPFADVALEYLHSQDPAERGLAAFALGSTGSERHVEALEGLIGDGALFEHFDGRGLVQSKVSEAAAWALGAIRARTVR